MGNAPVSIVMRFLELLSARDLTAATAYLSDDALMIFPGGNNFSTLDDFAQWAHGRYRNIDKTIAGCDVVHNPDSTSIVYCRGTLQGQWINGKSFNNIRFIDRFVIREGKISLQEVWNDLAETAGHV